MIARARRERAVLRARRRRGPWRYEPLGLWQIGGYDLWVAASWADRAARQPALHDCPRCTDAVLSLGQHLSWCRE